MDRKPRKLQDILSLEETNKLMQILAHRGEKKKMADKLGVAPQTVSMWIRNREFPKYCSSYLETIVIKENLSKIT